MAVSAQILAACSAIETPDSRLAKAPTMPGSGNKIADIQCNGRGANGEGWQWLSPMVTYRLDVCRSGDFLLFFSPTRTELPDSSDSAA